MNTRFVSICFLALAFSLLSPFTTASAQVQLSGRVSEIDNVSAKVLSKELELLRLNTRLKLYSLPRGPWSARRQAGIGFTNSTLSATGSFMNGIGRLYFLDNPRKAPANLFENASILRLLANCISTGTSVFEFCNDTVSDIKEKKQGISLNMMHERAHALKCDIDSLLSERKAIVETLEMDVAEKQAFVQESKLLSTLGDTAANEFALYYASARGNRTARRIGYLITITSNVCSGAGTITGIRANHIRGISSGRRTHMGGVGGICNIVSGSVNLMAPVLTRTGSALHRHFTRDALCEELNCKQDKNLLALKEQLQKYDSSLHANESLELHGVLLRKQALQASANILEKRQSMLSSEHVSARNRFIENMAVASVSAGTKIAYGVGGTVGAFKYTRDAFHRNEIQGGTAIAYGAGNALAALETARIRLGQEWKLLHKSGKSKEETLKDQLTELDSLQTAPQLATSPNNQIM